MYLQAISMAEAVNDVVERIDELILSRESTSGFYIGRKDFGIRNIKFARCMCRRINKINGIKIGVVKNCHFSLKISSEYCAKVYSNDRKNKLDIDNEI